MSELPPGWEWASVSDLAEVIAGQAPPGSSYNTDGDGTPLYQGKTDFSEMYLKEPRLWTTRPSRLAAAEDVLVSVRAPVGPTNLAASPCAIGRGLVAIRAHKGVGQRYLLYAIRASENKLIKQATGTTFAAITTGVIRDHRVPVAPTAEQQRIVAVIEEQSSRLDAGVAALLRAQDNLNRMRAAVLDGAFDSVSIKSWLPLGSLGTIVTGNTPPTADPANYGGELPFVTPSDFDHGDRICDVPRSLSLTGASRARRLPAGSVLATCIGATLGKIGLATVACATNQQINAVVPGEPVLGEYLFYALARPAFTKRMWEASSSTTMPILNKSKFSTLDIPVARVDDQKRVVEEVTDGLARVERLSVEVGRILLRTDRLRSSILHAAFSGKLVLQDPSDEPASVLLDRIATENTSSAKSTRTRKPRTTSRQKAQR